MIAAQKLDRALGVRLAAALEASWTTPALLVGLTGLSLFVRTRVLGGGFWIDEGISVGIAHHHLTSIPHLLREDGSPPLYYLLLGLWIRVFGEGESATHTLSLLFALGCIPLAYAVGRSLFGRLTGWCTAVLAAFDPFLTVYGQETRMYALLAFLSLLATLAYVEGVVRGRRPWLVALAPILAAMMYTHTWSLFFCVGLVVATFLMARERLVPLLVAGAAAFVLYAPWVPTLIFQARHTGAPWAGTPSFQWLVLSAGTVLPDNGAVFAFALVGGSALVRGLRGRLGEERRIVLLLAAAAGSAILLAWIVSFITPEWTARYFAAVLAPLLLLAARGTVRAGRLGLAALIAILFIWLGATLHDDKENARGLAAALGPSLQPGELVISTHPEQTPVLRYYLGTGLRWATTLGPVADPQVFDWRDAVDRLRAAQPRPTLDSVLRNVRPGKEFIVISPVFRDYRAWNAKWTRLVWRRSIAWTQLLAADPRFRLVRHITPNEIGAKRNYWKPLQAFVFKLVRSTPVRTLWHAPGGVSPPVAASSVASIATAIEAPRVLPTNDDPSAG